MTTLRDEKDAPWYSALRQRPHAFHAARYYPQFSYTLHTPEGYFEDPSGYELIVVVHGSGRAAAEYRNAFASFADAHRCVVLCPLFPVGILGNGYADGYKNLVEGHIRYDLALLSMVSDFEQASGRPFDKFRLFGFSGGGQFAHRFLYVWPERLDSVSIGSPGTMTRIDPDHDWWFGTRDVASLFGKACDLEKLRCVQVQLVAGDQDLEELWIPPWLEQAVKRLGPIGKNRVERLRQLRDNYEDKGIPVQLDLVPGVGHQGLKVVDAVQKFIAGKIRQ
ncbi:alpha/beta hydrolase [Acidovorax sp.]|uniref:alpha/beta hydrolase n=1 Tax=Acidovorax sp. TaxID=1872122 RepID=UPI003D01896C